MSKNELGDYFSFDIDPPVISIAPISCIIDINSLGFLKLASTVGNTGEKRSSILQKLPRLSTSVWLLIIFAVVLIIAVPVGLSLFGSLSSQSTLKMQLTQLQTRYNDLQKQTGSQVSLLNEVNVLKEDVDRTKKLFRNVDNSIEISQELINAAWKNDVVINSMNISQTRYKYAGIEYPVLTYTMNLSGQVAAFQNFLLETGKRLPSSYAVDVLIEPAEMQGKLDKATVTMRIVCNRQ